jgi:hypothetical protein
VVVVVAVAAPALDQEVEAALAVFFIVLYMQ